LTQLDVKELPDGVTLRIKVQPRASKNEIQGIMEGALRVRLTSPPVDGEANAACSVFLGQVLGVAKSKVEIVGGHTSRVKVVKVAGLSRQQVLDRVNCLLEAKN
jgi:uncharacterized protein